ncbi:MAG: DnaA regulatory inactivator Hda [Rhodocyclaceae bacterium]
MKQLLLDIQPDAPPTFEGFVTGTNGELLAALETLAAVPARESFYLWGMPGSGRSHLLRATGLAAQNQGRPVAFVEGPRAGDEMEMPADGLLIVDDVHQLGGAAQIALFRAFNAARDLGLALLLAGDVPPLQLALREDLRTRIGSALVFQVHPLDDEGKAQILACHAAGRGMRVEREVIDYLLRHGERDLPYLMAVLRALDRVSLERQRNITIPLLKDVLSSPPQV